MKTNSKRNIVKVTLLVAMVLGTGLLARPANAQAPIQGKFTLPFEAHWGQAVLPAGEYELKFAPADMPRMLAIRDAKTLRTVAFEPLDIQEDSGEGASVLLVGTRGRQHVVYSLTIAELGETFVYERPPVRAVEEVRKTQAVPVLVVKN